MQRTRSHILGESVGLLSIVNYSFTPMITREHHGLKLKKPQVIGDTSCASCSYNRYQGGTCEGAKQICTDFLEA
jgi:hypothetical protein